MTFHSTVLMHHPLRRGVLPGLPTWGQYSVQSPLPARTDNARGAFSGPVFRMQNSKCSRSKPGSCEVEEWCFVLVLGEHSLKRTQGSPRKRRRRQVATSNDLRVICQHSAVPRLLRL